MNDIYIVTSSVVLDDLLKAMNYHDDRRASVSGTEVLTVAVVAARYFQNHHERALAVMQRLGDIPRLSVSRFNRRLHALLKTLGELLDWWLALVRQETLYLIDSMPLPVCHLARAARCKQVQGRVFRGYCAAKDQRFFGFKLHLVCDSAGIPRAFIVLPASWHDLPPIHELTGELPAGAQVLADKAYNCDHDETLCYCFADIELIPLRKRNTWPNPPDHLALLCRYRGVIETVNSQFEKMDVQRLHARTNPGFFLKLFASLLTLSFNCLV